ncbi:MAG: hypothetical protein QOC70_1757 [Verrucomicrobiota bacterium]
MFPPLRYAARIAFTIVLISLAFGSSSARGAGGVPQPKRYAALLAKARAGTLQINRGEPVEGARFFLFRPFAKATPTPPPDVFSGVYRKTAKTSFSSGAVKSVATLDSLLGPLPQDSTMSQQFPTLLVKADTARIASEKRTVKVPAFIYWVASESDRDFHVILGSTAQLTSATIFMNSEVSGLPPAHPTLSPFPQRRTDIRNILANHQNINGLFKPPVPVFVTGSLLWDGEHRFPNNVGPESLRPTKAWEIHPIKLLAER